MLVASPTSACIIPAGPEFQDPPGIQNSPPYLVSASPPEGSRIVDPTPMFSVTPADLNVGDDLWVKWITEYPSNDLNTRSSPDPQRKVAPSTNGSPLREAVTFQLNCDQLNPLITTHQVMFAISDREFVATGEHADLLKTVDGTAPPLIVTWTWQKTCQGNTQ